MADSSLRHLKKQEQNARWEKLSPAERVNLASQMSAAATELRRAGLKALGFTPDEVARIERGR